MCKGQRNIAAVLILFKTILVIINTSIVFVDVNSINASIIAIAIIGFVLDIVIGFRR